MSVALDVVGTKQIIAAGTSGSYTGLTTSGSLANGAIIAAAAFGSNGVTGLTLKWGSQTMTPVTSLLAGSPGGLFIYVLTGVAAFGNQTLSLTWTGATTNCFVGAMSLTGVNQTTPCPNPNTATGTGTAISVNITSAVGEYVVAIMAGNAFPPNVNSVSGTQWWIDNSSFPEGANYTTGAATVTMSGVLSTSAAWSIIGTDIAAAGGTLISSFESPWSSSGRKVVMVGDGP